MTQSLEDYLETVSFLSDDGDVRVTDIAVRMGVSKPSVLTALKTLEERGFIQHERYSSVSLTKEGNVKALEIRERHTFLTSFLNKVVGVSEETAEKDACRMEHDLSPESFAAIKNYIKKTSK